MVPVTLSLKSKKASYRLYFDRRVSVIRGDSSSGKTLLCALLRSSKNNPKISVSSSAPVLVLDSYPVIDEALELLSGCVVFIDEYSELQYDTIFLSKILCIDAFFVFITIEAINTSYSIDSVFELTQNLNGEFENTKYYTNNVNRHRFRCAVVEDKRLGLAFTACSYLVRQQMVQIILQFLRIPKRVKENCIYSIRLILVGSTILYIFLLAQEK